MDKPLDRAKIQELLDMTGGETAWLRELLQTYVDDTRSRLDELGQLVNGHGSADRIQRAAHGIKGSSANIGARHMAELCQRMEQIGRAGDVAAAGSQFAALQQEFQRICDDIPAALGA